MKEKLDELKEILRNFHKTKPDELKDIDELVSQAAYEIIGLDES